MGDNSRIEWTDATWNPVTGCTKVSPGCKNCYAERMAHRLFLMGSERYKNGFELTLHADLLERPLEWRLPKRIFVNSMSDLFQQEVPLPFIKRVFRTMEKAHWHFFQILTKRADRLAEVAASLHWPQNVWMGVSVESEKYVFRIERLRTVPAAVRFLSVEPLLSPIPNLPLEGIDWVIVGGESGPNARPMNPVWVRQILKQCRQHDVPFFFKQWGGVNKKSAGRLLNGKTYDEYPVERVPVGG